MAAAAFLATLALGARGVAAQSEVPADTFADAGARSLVLQARATRSGAAEGLTSYEARMTERMRVGMGIGGRITSVERTLYHRERAAQVYWSAEGDNRIRWLGSRTGQPALGEETREGGPFGLDLDLDIEDELGLDDIRAPLRYDPRADRLDLFDAGFVQPISDEGLRTYRFRSGDTLRISLNAPDRSVELVEVIVTPRRDAWETVSGSLWFDRETGVLTRAVYRPSGVWDHETQEPGDLDGVPGILKPAIGRVDHIVVEYALYEQRFWLPRRMVADGVFDWGGMVRMPLQIEWTVADYALGEVPSALVLPSDSVREGRYRLDPGLPGGRGRWTVLQPTDRSRLETSDALPAPLRPDDASAFDREELQPLLDRLDQVAPPAHRVSRLRWEDALRSLRYDRVRGLSVAVGERVAVSKLALDLAARSGTAAWEPTGRVELGPVTEAVRGRASPPRAWAVAAYSELRSANDDWGAISTIGNSVATLVAGHDDGEFFRITGGEARMGGARGGWVFEGALFAERHDPLAKATNFALATLGGGALRPNLTAEAGTWGGVRADLRVGGRQDQEGRALALRGAGEWAGGERAYARGLAEVTLVGLTLGPVGLGARVSAGLASASTPLQRRFHLGGTTTVRGHPGSSQAGTAFALGRVELGTRVAAARLVAFGDLGWAGARSEIDDARPLAALGAGLSLLDGLFRVDLARGLRGEGGWRLHLYLDGLR